MLITPFPGLGLLHRVEPEEAERESTARPRKEDESLAVLSRLCNKESLFCFSKPGYEPQFPVTTRANIFAYHDRWQFMLVQKGLDFSR
jgi:hypothetical protein